MTDTFLENLEIGIQGEEIIRNILKRIIKEYAGKKIDMFFQADIIFHNSEENKWYLVEVKTQERFESPPFDGHGLPVWQIKSRLRYQEDSGTKAILMVIEKNSNEKIVYWNYLDVLNGLEYFDTKGIKPRRVFNIKNFRHFRY